MTEEKTVEKIKKVKIIKKIDKREVIEKKREYSKLDVLEQAILEEVKKMKKD